MFDDHIHAVRVVAGHHHQHHVIQSSEDLRIFGGRHAVGEDRQALARTDLTGVHGKRFQQEDATVADQLRPLVRWDRRIEGEAPVGFLELFEPLQVSRGGDERDVHRPAEGRLAHLAHFDAVGGRRQLEQISNELAIIHELAIAARDEPEKAFRAPDLRARLRNSEGGKSRADQEQGAE
jgi:hypothetical protein